MPPGRRAARGRRRGGYLFNTTIAGIEQADAILLIGTNPRWEAPVLNARIRKRYLHGGCPVGQHRPGASISPIRSSGWAPARRPCARWSTASIGFSEKLKAAKKPMIIVGMGALARADGAAVLALARELADKLGAVRADWNGFTVLHTAAARVGGLDLGFVPGEGGRDVAGILAGCEKGEIDVVYLLGADEIDTARLGKTFVIYQGHHGDAGAHRADVILPGAAYTEKTGTYVNTEGRVQRGAAAPVYPPGDAREDWTILRALSERARQDPAVRHAGPAARAPGRGEPGLRRASISSAARRVGQLRQGRRASDAPFVSPIANFYMTDPISRASHDDGRMHGARAPQLMAAE